MFRRRQDPFARARHRRRIRKLRLLGLLAVLALLGLSAFTFGFVRAISGEIPKLDPRYRARLEQNGYIYNSDGNRILAVLRGSQARRLVSGEQVADVMKLAIVAIEDRRFYEHRGIDMRSVGRALWADLRQREIVQGGSTITQQFVKNYVDADDASFARKLKEAALAWQLEQQWPKERILTAYLNTIYFGNGAYGIEQAARAYFGNKSADRLTLAEAALLAGIPKDPSRFDPIAHPDEARTRRGVVLRAMLEQRMITPRHFRRALRAPLPDPDEVGLRGTQGPAGYFVNYVKQLLIDSKRYGPQKVFGGGLRVRTSIDLELQRLAQRSISKWLTRPNGPSAALVAVEPRTGRVLAMVGGESFRQSQFNLAVQSRRQPGSAFKPFVLATALERGISPETTFESRPVTIPLGDRVWVVSNYEDAYAGSIDVDGATVTSDNSVFAQLTALVGPRSVAQTARKLGVRTRLRGYFSIGLGAQAVNPLELARSYSAFIRGFRIDGSVLGNHPRAILSVRDPTRGLQENRVQPKRVLTPRTAALVTSLLQDVVRQGTGTAAALSDGRPAAGKTGTTENYGDAWFVGYTPQLVAAVWVGYPDELRPMLTDFNGDPVAGGTYPARIWKAFMERALRHLVAEPEPFPPRPPSYGYEAFVVNRSGRLRASNGNCRGAKSVVLMSGAPALETAPCKPNEVDVPRVVGEPLDEARARLTAQPLTPELVYKPARPKEPVGVVLRQFPARGTLSSYDEVKLVLARPLHGIVPGVVGKQLARARSRLSGQRLVPRVVRFGPGPEGRVLFQAPKVGVAAAPGMVVKLVVGRG